MKMDELNKLQRSRKTKDKSIPYDTYFGEMDIDSIDIEERINLAYAFEEVFLTAFLMMENMLDKTEEIDRNRIYTYIESNIGDIIYDYDKELESDSYIVSRLYDLGRELVKSTAEHQDDSYYFSSDRAKFDAENEVNTICNYKNYKDASKGKSLKRWLTMKDKRVRPTHTEVDDEIIPIDEYFQVGSSLMLFPKDLSQSPNPEEVVNCRCSIEYL